MAIKYSDLLYVHDGIALKKITWEMLVKKQIPGTCKLVLERKVSGTWTQYSITAQEFWDESSKLKYDKDYYMVERNKVLKHAQLRMPHETDPVILDYASQSKTKAYPDNNILIDLWGTLDPPGTNRRTQFQISNYADGSSWTNIGPRDHGEYIPTWQQVGKFIRLKQTERNVEGVDVDKYSNVLEVMLPKLAEEAIYFRLTSPRPGNMSLASGSISLYVWEGGKWEVEGTVNSKKFAIRSGEVYGMVAARNLSGLRFGYHADGGSGDTHQSVYWEGNLAANRWSEGSVEIFDLSCMTYITNASSMFLGLEKFNQNLDWWNMANVTDFTSCFAWCHSFNQPVQNWDWSGGVVLNQAFMHCRSFNQPVSNMKIGSKHPIREAHSVFKGCWEFNQDISNLKIENARGVLYFLHNCGKFNGRVGRWKWDSTQHAYGGRTSIRGFFHGCKQFNQEVSWDTALVDDIAELFKGCSVFNRSVNFDTSNCKSLRYMFTNCARFNQPVCFNVTNCVNFAFVFRDASTFNQNVNWDVSNGTNFERMFSYARLFKKNLTSWRVENATRYDNFGTGSRMEPSDYPHF